MTNALLVIIAACWAAERAHFYRSYGERQSSQQRRQTSTRASDDRNPPKDNALGEVRRPLEDVDRYPSVDRTAS